MKGSGEGQGETQEEGAGLEGSGEGVDISHYLCSSTNYRRKEILHPLDAEATNVEGKTARAIFTEQHKELKDKAGRWIKDTVNSCLMAATIIATVVFAAALKVPGGSKEKTGTPHFVRRASFIIFAISDAIVLILSSYSILSTFSINISNDRSVLCDYVHCLQRWDAVDSYSCYGNGLFHELHVLGESSNYH
ncbi:hypothetical protein Pint_12293 [Pistacia integerrima]|uniref:Uncharacterized protein n=1 Tax=Pistacia integerrima TaxID=434235 RepID=A0ACC0XG53_9ROSI|nr:hypothetical protein Pint_12293 [Pistacia integerrima]